MMPERIITSVSEIKLIILMVLSWAARLAFMSNLTPGVIVRQLIISIFLGIIAAEYVATEPFEEWVNIVLFCCVVFLADDILVLVLNFGKYAKDNQNIIFKKILSWLTGTK